MLAVPNDACSLRYFGICNANQIFYIMFYEKSGEYNLRSKNLLMLPQTNNIRYGNDSIVSRGVAASYGTVNAKRYSRYLIFDIR